MAHYLEDDTSIGGTIRRTILGLLLIISGIVCCSVTLIVVTDNACYADANFRLPVYPESEVINVQYDFLRPRGTGSTFMVFYTPDSVTSVRRWYAEYRQKITREIYSSTRPGSFNPILSSVNYRIVESPDGKGTLIYHIIECSYH